MGLLHLLDEEQETAADNGQNRVVDVAPSTVGAEGGVEQVVSDELAKEPAGYESVPAERVTPVFLGAVLCEREAVDDVDGLPTAQRIYFAFEADQFPYPMRLAVLSFWWFREPGEAILGVRLLGPDGSEMAGLSAEAAVERASFYSHRVRFIDPGQGTFDIPGPGTYRVEIWAGEEQVGAYPLVVTERVAAEEDLVEKVSEEQR